MHPVLVLRSVLDAGEFVDRQRVEIASYRDSHMLGWVESFRRQIREEPRALRAYVDIEPQRLELCADMFRRLEFLVTELWMAMKMPP